MVRDLQRLPLLNSVSFSSCFVAPQAGGDHNLEVSGSNSESGLEREIR
jgi:hypothetical protein